MTFARVEQASMNEAESTRFQAYSLKDTQRDETSMSSKHILIYGVNPGPTKSIIPLAEEFFRRGAQVSFRLCEPSLSSVLEYFDNRITSTPDLANDVNVAFTCGHINVDSVTNDMARIKVANPDLAIVTMDDNFDGTIPIIERLVGLGVPPTVSFIMNPQSKSKLERLFLDHEATGRVVVTNNPAFERFYETQNHNPQLKRGFRDDLQIAEANKVLTFIGFPEGDYPSDYHDYVFESVATAMELIQDKYSFIYWPHGRGEDRLPRQFENVSNCDQIIFHQRDWWSKHHIGIHKQLIGADIALMTNSTASAEVFTAWGKGVLPMSVPIDISLIDDFPHLSINTTLRRKELVSYMPSREFLISTLAQAMLSPFDFAPHDAQARIHKLEWDRSPIEVIMSELAKI